jgi:hypothetical protein
MLNYKKILISYPLPPMLGFIIFIFGFRIEPKPSRMLSTSSITEPDPWVPLNAVFLVGTGV